MLQIVWNIVKYIYGLFYALVRPVKRLVCRRRKLSTSEDSGLTSVSTGNLRISTPQQYGDELDNSNLEMEAWDSWENPTGRGGAAGAGDAHLNGYRGKPSLGVSSIQNYHYNQQKLQQQQAEPEPEPDFFEDMTPTVKKQAKNPTGRGGAAGAGDAHLNGYRGKPSLGVSSIQNYHYNQQKLQQQQAEPEPEPDFFEDMTPTVKKQAKILIRKKEEDISNQAISSRLAVMSDVPMVTSQLEAWEEQQGNAWENDDAAEDLTWQAEEAIKETRKKERAQRAAQHQRRKQQREQEKGRTATAAARGGSLATRVS
ncbi:receptor-binding cancer antigen expressed on siso cells-like protein [Plakobranchus ocellatus]|uniref:Receptor-binding cancer antigen expressed on siso cells-like protein n=1 Tax=Plakobranchus ocellatus TaxID=259542 RepID=A0AAV3Z5D5_9GAST|nr:receptor-binding cancer antigen expressed on siso cells-like protein [Plakobranchus ocellatus]